MLNKRLVLCLFLVLILASLCAQKVVSIGADGETVLTATEEDPRIEIDLDVNHGGGGSVSPEEPPTHDDHVADGVPPVGLDSTPEVPESTATLSTPKTSLKTPENVRQSVKEGNRKPKSDAGSGSYYGSNEGHTDQFTKPAPPQAKRTPAKPKVRMGGQPLSGTHDLEDRLHFELRQSRKMTDRDIAENTARASRFKIARKHAYPVEHILEIYNDPNTNLYDVLGVKDKATDSELSKVYRSRAREVHPDKNPHPDAKLAFDALAEAYSVLSSPAQREQYDTERRSQVASARARRFNSRKIRKRLTDELENWKSALLLLHYEVVFTETASGLQRNGAGQTLQLLYERVKSAVMAKVAGMKLALHREIEHYVLLPSTGDRLQLLHEQLWRHKYHMLVLLLFVGLRMR